MDFTYGWDFYKKESKLRKYNITKKNRAFLESFDFGLFVNGKIDAAPDSLKGNYGDIGFIVKTKFNILNLPATNETKNNDLSLQVAVGILAIECKGFVALNLGVGFNIFEEFMKKKLK